MQLILIIITVLLLPICRYTLCRIAMVIRLRRICRQIGARMRFRSPAAVFDKRFGTKNSLYIQTNECMYSIRLIGFFCRATRLRIYGRNQYSVKNYSLPVVGMMTLNTRSEIKNKPECDFKAFMPDTYISPMPCYLLCPDISCGLFASDKFDAPAREFCDGDTVHGIAFFTLRGLCRHLMTL